MSDGTVGPSMADVHDAEHRVVMVHPLSGTGLVLLYETELSGRHARFRLTAGEGPGEELLCLHDDVPVDPDDWGWPPDDIAELVCHVVAHIQTRTAPTWDCPLWAEHH